MPHWRRVASILGTRLIFWHKQVLQSGAVLILWSFSDPGRLSSKDSFPLIFVPFYIIFIHYVIVHIWVLQLLPSVRCMLERACCVASRSYSSVVTVNAESGWEQRGKLPFYRLLLRYIRRYRAILIYYRGNIRKSLHRSTKYTQSITGKRHAITWNGSGKQKRGKGGKERVNISNFHRDSAYIASRLITAINRRTVYSLIDPSIGFDI